MGVLFGQFHSLYLKWELQAFFPPLLLNMLNFSVRNLAESIELLQTIDSYNSSFVLMLTKVQTSIRSSQGRSDRSKMRMRKKGTLQQCQDHERTLLQIAHGAARGVFPFFIMHPGSQSLNRFLEIKDKE